MLEIDGSIGEGGGQVLRTALSMACCLQKPVKISNIRSGRENPGLRPQHLAVCNLLAKISCGKVWGASIGSREIIFEPGNIAGGEYSFDIGTAGSCTLFLQAALPALLSAKGDCTLAVKGGTHVRCSPTFEYFSEVFLPAARKFGAKCGCEIRSVGFYPKGGGEIILKTSPSTLSGCEFLAEKLPAARYRILSSSLPPHVSQREEGKIKELLGGKFSLSGGAAEAPSPSAGNAITIWSGMHGGCAVGERGKMAEKVAEEACADFLAGAQNGASVDKHLADQLLLYAALSDGRTSYSAPEFTSHLVTNAEVLRRLTHQVRHEAEGRDSLGEGVPSHLMTGRNIILGDEGRVEAY